MFKRILNNWKIMLVGIVVLGFILRADNLNTWPRQGATFDEYAWTWQGINLIQQKIPVSWSPHQQYEDRKQIIYQETHFQIVKPYLEHPPLFGLVAGSFAILNGATDMYDVDIGIIRPLALLLGTLSIILVFILAQKLYTPRIGLLAALIYSVTPTVAVGSRIVQNENFFIPVFLTALILITHYLKTKKRLFLYLTAIICGLLILAKIPWVAAALSIMMILFYKNKRRDGVLVLAVSSIFFILFLVYGYFYDWNLFVNLWKLQIARYDLTFNSIFALFTQPYLADRLLVDGWIYFGWFAFILLLVKDLKKNFVLIFAILGYFLVFVFAIPNEMSHGWYRYPFYPFLALSTALFLKEYFNKNYILTFLFLIFVGLAMFETTWKSTFGFSFPVFRGYLFLSGLSLLPMFFPKKGKIASVASYTSLVIVFLLTIWTVFSYNEQ